MLHVTPIRHLSEDGSGCVARCAQRHSVIRITRNKIRTPEKRATNRSHVCRTRMGFGYTPHAQRGGRGTREARAETPAATASACLSDNTNSISDRRKARRTCSHPAGDSGRVKADGTSSRDYTPVVRCLRGAGRLRTTGIGGPAIHGVCTGKHGERIWGAGASCRRRRTACRTGQRNWGLDRRLSAAPTKSIPWVYGVWENMVGRPAGRRSVYNNGQIQPSQLNTRKFVLTSSPVRCQLESGQRRSWPVAGGGPQDLQFRKAAVNSDLPYYATSPKPGEGPTGNACPSAVHVPNGTAQRRKQRSRLHTGLVKAVNGRPQRGNRRHRPIRTAPRRQFASA